MNRNATPDQNAAHAIALQALGPHGGPWPDSAIFYQRRMVRAERAAREARSRGPVDEDSAAAQ